MKVALEFTFIA